VLTHTKYLSIAAAAVFSVDPKSALETICGKVICLSHKVYIPDLFEVRKWVEHP
jgi:hypothetical protein